MSHPTALMTALVALFACGGDGGKDTPPSSDDTDVTADDTDVAADDTDAAEDSDQPTFPPGTAQVRVMNLTPNVITMSGDDVNGDPVSVDMAPLTLSPYTNLPVGTGVMTFDFDSPGNQMDFSALEEFSRAIVIIGEISGYTTLTAQREPAQTPGSRTLVLGTTARRVEFSTATASYDLPSGDFAEVRTLTHTMPNDEATLMWRTYGKPFYFTAARVPEDGLAYIFNSDRSSEGFGNYFIATGPGPVRPLGSDVSLYAYSADVVSGSPMTFTARTPWGDYTVATGVTARHSLALPYARVPIDATEIIATDGTTPVSTDITMTWGIDHAIAVLHRADGVPGIRLVEGEPNNRIVTGDGYVMLRNMTRYNLDARCYYSFRGWVPPDGTVTTFISPVSVLSIITAQNCNLTTAVVPDVPPAIPTHNFSIRTEHIRGYHNGFVAETGANLQVYWAYRITDDANVYMTYAHMAMP